METIATTIRRRELSPSRLGAIAERLEKDVAASAIPGAMAVIGSHSGVTFEHTVGLRNVADGEPLRPDVIWRIYSMTKPIVKVAAMVLVEAGLLCCDQPPCRSPPIWATACSLRWRSSAEQLGGQGRQVTTRKELADALAHAHATTGRFQLR